MSEGRIAELKRRGVVRVAGPDAEAFLDNLVTSDIGGCGPGQALFTALLTPQGKILFDFIVFHDGEQFLIDVPKTALADFIKRLAIYKLRARVTVEDVSRDYRIVAVWSPAGVAHIDGIAAPDPRLAALGWRIVMPADRPVARAGFAPASEADYDAHRIALGIPEGGVDFAFGDAYPHDADMDQLGGVDFGKGCFIGQEVVARMEHRGTARRRFVLAAGSNLPAVGTEVKAGERALGTFGSSSESAGLALVRLDRAREAIDAGTTILAGDAAVTLKLPGWATFGWPEAAAGD